MQPTAYGLCRAAAMPNDWRQPVAHRNSMQVAADVIRDGLCVELLSESGDFVAEVFRSDRDRSVVVNTFSYDVPLEAIDALVAYAKSGLDPFADGSPLNAAIVVALELVRPGEGGKVS